MFIVSITAIVKMLDAFPLSGQIHPQEERKKYDDSFTAYSLADVAM